MGVSQPPDPSARDSYRVDRESTSFRAIAEVQIRNRIFDGSFPPGHRLNEVDLSQKLDVSRGPVREALQRLLTEGLVTYAPFRGMSVRSFDTHETRDLYQTRIALESYAARLAAERIEPRDADELTAMMDETEVFFEDQPDAAYPAHLDFHDKILAMSGNRRLIDTARNVMNLIQVARQSSARRPSRSATALDEHQAIAAAIGAGDGVRAQELMMRHIATSMTNALDAMTRSEEKGSMHG